MNVRIEGTTVMVDLSERNLEDLQEQIKEGLPGRLVRLCEGDLFLSVSVQEDDRHYAERVPGPGSGLLDNPHPPQEVNEA